MALKKNYLVIVGLIGWGVLALGYGLGLSHVEQRLTTLTLLATIVGVLALGAAAWLMNRHAHQPMIAFPWKKMIMMAAIVVLSFVLFALLNYVSSIYNVRWDATKFKQHTLTSKTKGVLQDLTENVAITIFYVGLPPKYLDDLLKEYERQSQGKVKTEIVDPLVQLGYAAQFGRVVKADEKKAFVRSGHEEREINFGDQPLTEEMLTNTVLRITRKARTACFLTGHKELPVFDKSETGLTTLVKLLLGNNIVVKELFLRMESNIPDDCAVLVIAGPQEFLSPEEEAMVRDYLSKGGDALFLIEHTLITTPEKPLTPEEMDKNPSLNSILNEWGIHVANDIVVDLASHASGDPGSPATRNYMPHEALVKELDYTFYVRPRSISITLQRRPTIKVVPFVLTASKEVSWGETNRMLTVKFNPEEDRMGPVPISVVAWEPRTPDNGKISDTRLIVFTDADFLTNTYIGQFSNARMGLNVISWLAELDYEPFVDQEEIKVERLDLTSQQKRMIAVWLMLLPVLIATMGILVWVKKNV
ncbi:MAG: GldG family protein [Candidatus Omnitrophota bacterium]|nr:GldG family protein [Candidatus Omnitrophota bacterium]